MQQIKACRFGLAVAGDDAIRRKARALTGRVFNALLNVKHVLIIHRDCTAENQPSPVFPFQGNRGAFGKCAAALKRPLGCGVRCAATVAGSCAGPAPDGIIWICRIGGGQQNHGFGIVTQGYIIIGEVEVINPATLQRDRAGEPAGAHIDARGLNRRGFGRGRRCSFATRQGGWRVGASGAWRGERAFGQGFQLGRELGLCWFRWKQDRPAENHGHAERNRQNHIFVLVFHRKHSAWRS